MKLGPRELFLVLRRVLILDVSRALRLGPKFVIGATYSWCLTSAIVMTALLILTVAPGKRAISNLSHGDM